MVKRRNGQNITHDTRAESEETVDKAKRYRQIIQILAESKEPMSAKEIAVALYKKKYTPSTERNFAAPRLTELSKMGVVEPVGKKICKYTKKAVSVYELL